MYHLTLWIVFGLSISVIGTFFIHQQECKYCSQIMDAVSTPMSTSPPPPGAEKACLRYRQRVWRRHDFPAYALALRLVVLVQLSSCSVERVFSKLDLIRDACGEKMRLSVKFACFCNATAICQRWQRLWVQRADQITYDYCCPRYLLKVFERM